METFALQDVSFTYPEENTPALSHVNLILPAGSFSVLCGRSGCGKTTLLRQLKPAVSPHGLLSGRILFRGKPFLELSERELAAQIGYVLQNPENQLVTDKVWHELAFGLENLGLRPEVIRLRVAEMANFFGIEAWFHQDTSDLSGGQKQLLNLAAVMAMQPQVLLLDEPTAQLDPIAASEFLRAVKKINEELGVAVLLSEHRLEEAFALCDRAVVLDAGHVVADAPPCEAARVLRDSGHSMFFSMPAPIRIAMETGGKGDIPLTVREGRSWLSHYVGTREIIPELPAEPAAFMEKEALCIKNAWFRYRKDTPDVVRGLTLTVKQGELFCLVGGNGAGKTTALSLLSGQNRPQRGHVRLFGKDLKSYRERELFDHNLGVLPQDPQTLFVCPTVRRDLLEMLEESGLSQCEKKGRVQQVAELAEVEPLLERHPYDLSGGEQQRAALAKVLLLEPRVLLLDEPTKGMDGFFKEKLAKILLRLTTQGTAVFMVSHDIEFCARWAHRCALFFDGSVASQGTPRAFFSGNSFYTTAANRMARGVFSSAVTDEDVIFLCRKIQK